MIRQLQREKLLKLLRAEDPPFKILILDSITQDILSPILKVSDLRSMGVTAHFSISSVRSQIKEIAAFYFISCDLDKNTSIASIEKDLSRDLYGEYYINSAFSFRRTEIERLANAASENQISLKVKSVYDCFLQFISLTNNLFTFNISDSFNRRNENDIIRYCTSGLMSVFVTLGEIPFIVSQNEELGKALEQKIKNTKVIKNTNKRPLLIILDRHFDVVTPTKHVMGYVELMHDLLSIKLNKVENINLDTDSEFYQSNWHFDFPTVADIVDKELSSYRKELALRSLNEKSDRSQIEAAMESAPFLQKKSEIVNNNISLCSKILEEIKKRNLDEFLRMEESFDPNEIISLSEMGNDNDIIRLCIQMINTKNYDLIFPILIKRKINPNIIEYFKNCIKLEEESTFKSGFGSKVKSFLFKKNLPIYSAVENILSQVKNQSFEGNFSVFDPSHSGIYQSEISKIVVFINGGTTYTELKSLMELEKIINIPIILGGSEILNADEFIRQTKMELI